MAWYRITFFAKQGRGLQAIKLIPANTVIIRSPVVVVPTSEIYPKGVLVHYIFKFGNRVAIALGDASLLNYNSPGNCDYYPDLNRRTIVVRSNRQIRPGEQLTIDYGWHEPHFVGIGNNPMVPKGKLQVKPINKPLRALANRLSANLGVIEQAEWRDTNNEEHSPLHEVFVKHGLQHTRTLENEHGDKQYYYTTRPPYYSRSDLSEFEKDLHAEGHELVGRHPHNFHPHKGIVAASYYKNNKGNSQVVLGSHGPRDLVSDATHRLIKSATMKQTTAKFKSDSPYLRIAPEQGTTMKTETARERPRLRYLKEAHDHKFSSEFYRRYINQKDYSLFPIFQQELDDLISAYRGQGLPAIEDRVNNGRENTPTPEQLHVMNPADLVATSPTIPQTAMALARVLISRQK